MTSLHYAWRGELTHDEVEALHAEGFDREPVPAPAADWPGQLRGHSLGWVCARRATDGRLVGFVNVAWDGGAHAFLLDTVVAADHRRLGVAARLVALAEAEARAAGCEWLHVDFEEHLRPFYLDACGFRPTAAGLIPLRG
ncbi:GNAT family N-acetyltransferase [Streptomyces millisiae]|uniref:GNAT family N-acetyltransferase n=1 Tax=Streptomyces millisiae TaxID=3075542 RepID=A0ABU2M0E1_9ACTN|nr:GNAT family N-acetyltransferase [Streptomyces sp. DSM 44918]MDT0323028.1 GNAT family N-acetyltransferase [Streptomyces sp. DSM 44918]